MFTPPGSELSAAALSDGPGFFVRLVRSPAALACIVVIVLFTVIAVVAPLVFPDVGKQYAGDLLAARQGPSLQHLLGTDSLGRDVLDRLLVGTRVTMLAVAEVLALSLAVGVPLGLVAGFFGGYVDRLITWSGNLVFSMPVIVILLVVLTVFRANAGVAMAAYALLVAPSLMWVVRSATLAIRKELYIAAALVSGLTRPYILAFHVLPRIAGPVIVQGSLIAAQALIVQSGLAFLGLLVQEPAPSWGGMVASGVQEISRQPWLIIPPGLSIVVAVLAFGILGDAVRDVTTGAWAPAVAGPRRAPAPRRGAVSGPVLAPANPRTLLALEEVTIGFPTEGGMRTVVERASFSIAPGETVGLVGESGSGKTVSAMSIIGLLPAHGEVQSGRIVFGGRDLASLSETQMRGLRGREIGLISQEPLVSMNPAFRVGRQLAEVVRLHRGLSRRESYKEALQLLRDVHLPDPEGVASCYPHELSGGMAQRVVIARALAGNPKLLIADEPTTALDVTVQAEILDLLRELKKTRGMAMLLVTHDWGVAADTCDRVIVMYAGQVVESAPIEAIFREPRHPYTEALLAADVHRTELTGALSTIPGTVPVAGTWPSGCHFHPRCLYATVECTSREITMENTGPGRQTRCVHHEKLAGKGAKSPS